MHLFALSKMRKRDPANVQTSKYVMEKYTEKYGEMRCAIWYHLYNLKNVRNTYGGVLILVKLQESAWVFFTFFKPTTLLK